MKARIQENKTPLIVGVLILIAILIYVYQNKLASFFLYGGASSSAAVSSGANVVSNSGNNSSNVSDDTILKKGSTGDNVKKLQQLLNIKHGNNKPQILPYLVEDGNFGNATEVMLKKWTKKTSISIAELIKALT